jgi:hypothetical protein
MGTNRLKLFGSLYLCVGGITNVLLYGRKEVNAFIPFVVHRRNVDKHHRKYRGGKLLYENGIDQCCPPPILTSTSVKVSWMKRYNELVKYKEENGHANVPRKGGSLGNWVSKQRKNRNILNDEQKQLLEKIDFVWNLRPKKEKKKSNREYFSWEDRFSQLKEFYKKEGHVCPSKEKNLALYRWVQHQRAQKIKYDQLHSKTDSSDEQISTVKNNQKCRLSKDRVQLLEEIDFVWDVLEHRWKIQFQNLLEYKQKHGHVHVPRSDKTTLSRWCGTQRTMYKEKRMSKERIDALENIGFCWNVHDEAWYQQYQSMNPKWQSLQRSEKRYAERGFHTHLKESRQQLLEKTPGWSWEYVHETRWNEHFIELKEFYEEHGHMKVKSPKSLATWVRDQRFYYRAFLNDEPSSMTLKRKQMLDTLNFQH